MPRITTEDQVPAKRSGGGGGRDRQYKIDLDVLEQIVGRVDAETQFPLWMTYEPEDFDGAKLPTFQGQITNWVERYNQANGTDFMARFRNEPVEFDSKGDPIAYRSHVKIVQMTDEDYKRRKEMRERRAQKEREAKAANTQAADSQAVPA